MIPFLSRRYQISAHSELYPPHPPIIGYLPASFPVQFDRFQPPTTFATSRPPSSPPPRLAAIMAAFLPRPPVPQRPLQDLPPSSPPDPAMFHLNNASQPPVSTRTLSDSRTPQRLSGDYRSNGMPGFSGADGALPAASAGPQVHIANGGLRNRGLGGGVLFEGARSPPGTKSSCPWKTCTKTPS